MDLDHNAIVAFSKSWGLFYLIAFALGVLVYTFWPSNRKRFQLFCYSQGGTQPRPPQPAWVGYLACAKHMEPAKRPQKKLLIGV